MKSVCVCGGGGGGGVFDILSKFYFFLRNKGEVGINCKLI